MADGIIIDQLPTLPLPLSDADEFPVERGNASYKVRADSLREGFFAIPENITSQVTVTTENLPYSGHTVRVMRCGNIVQVTVTAIKLTQTVSGWFDMAAGLPPATSNQNIVNMVANAAQTYPTPLRLRITTGGVLQCTSGETDATYTINFIYFTT